MVPLSYLHFPLLKLHCHKLKEKITVKLVRMDTYIDFNEGYIFLTGTYIFFIFRLIHHLFSSSVNDFILDHCYTIKYTSVGDATKSIQRLGRGCFMAKTDVKSALRIIPIYPSR